MKNPAQNNRKIVKSAREVLVGGVNSPVRAFKGLGFDFLPIREASGSRVYDYSGNSYIDYVLSFGALILGHCDRYVVKEIKKAVEKGSGFGATSSKEVELAALIKEAIPPIEKIRFVNSGTEAVMGAIRVARGYTGRNKIVKLVNSYHGHADYLLAKAGSGLATQSIPLSKGVPKEFLRETIILSSTDPGSIDAVFNRYGKEIAAVIVEPVGGNYGVIGPDLNFLKAVRRLSSRCGSLLIFDEVITGFRFHYGAAAAVFDIEPDLFCLGKIIGGGLPVGAFAGPGSIMKVLAPEGEVYQASTFGGNPVVMSAGIAALKRIGRIEKQYPRLANMAEEIRQTLKSEAAGRGFAIEVSNFGSIFSVKFADKKNFKYFYKRLLLAGVFFAPSEYEANFISFAHTRNDIKKTKDAIKRIFGNWKKRRRDEYR